MRIKTKDDRRVRIQLRQRKRISGTKERPRLSVFRSVTHIYAQVIDDLTGETLVSASTVEAVGQGRARQGGARRQPQGRRGDRQGDRRAFDREGHQARGVRPQRVPVPRAHPRRGGRCAQSGTGILGALCELASESTRASSTSRTTWCDQPRDQGGQGRQEPELQRAGRRRRRPRRGRLRHRQGEGSAVGDQEGHRGGEEEPDSRAARRARRSRTGSSATSARAACC